MQLWNYLACPYSALCSLGQWSLVYTLQYQHVHSIPRKSDFHWKEWINLSDSHSSAYQCHNTEGVILNYGRDHCESTKPLMHSSSYTAWEVHWREALDIPFLAFSHLIQLLIIAAPISLWWPICSNKAIWNQALGWLQQATSWFKNDFLAWIKS